MESKTLNLQPEGERIVFTAEDFQELLEFRFGAQPESVGNIVSEFAHAKVAPLVEENARLREALEFYANGNHFQESNDEDCEKYSEPETVSGEPTNFVCGHGDYTAEDGEIARAALNPK